MNYNKYIDQTINLAKFNNAKFTNNDVSYDIVIPVYNGFLELKKCAESLIKFTNTRHKIYFYNDASTNKQVKLWLDKLADKHKHITVIHQTENLGYLKNSNQALSNTTNDVILLNADTQVTHNWLQELAIIASNDKVAIVCPLSNNATILSLDNTLLTSIDKLKHFSGQWYPIPTAVGSCMLIKRAIIDEQGVFDEYYNPGYGEECDYSLRLRLTGYDIACAPASFVFHSGSASFASESNLLKQQHQKLLDLRWPHYSKEIQHFCENNPITMVNEYLACNSNKDNVLHIVHGTENKGGVELFTQELLKSLPDDVFNTVLIPSAQSISGLPSKISKLNKTTRVINYQFINQLVSTKIGNRNADLFHEKLDTMFIRILMSGQYKVVHFHSFVGLGSLIWPLICQKLGIKYMVSCHDHFSICFNFSLLKNNNTEYCNKTVCSEQDKECVDCLKQITNYSSTSTEIYINERNKIWDKITAHAQEIIFPSQYLYDIVSKKFSINTVKLHRIEPYVYSSNRFKRTRKTCKKIQIAFLGTFTREKGAQIFIDAYKHLASIDAPCDASWQIIGKIHPVYKTQLSQLDIKCTGIYDREALTTLLRKVDLIILPSIGPETYSITLTEAWLNNISVIASNIGATKSRIIPDNNGQLFEAGNANSLAEKITNLVENPHLIDSMQESLAKTDYSTKSSVEKLMSLYSKYFIHSEPLKITSSINKTKHLKTPINNAFHTMQKWLYSEMTLEAESDWSISDNIDIVILGSNSELINNTIRSCIEYSPKSNIIILFKDHYKPEADSSQFTCIITEGHRLNDNFGNWIKSFKQSKKPIGLADYALIDCQEQIYAPQFLANFDANSFLNQKFRLGVMLYNFNSDYKTLNQNFSQFIASNKPIYKLIETIKYNDFSKFIHYFPHLSYLYKDSIWVKNWKQEIQWHKHRKNFDNKITPNLGTLAIFIFSNKNKDQINSTLACLKNQKNIKLEHIYVFSKDNMIFETFDELTVSCHFLDFNQPEIYINPVAKRCQSDNILVINDNILFKSDNVLNQLNQALNKDYLTAVSPLFYSARHDGYALTEKLGAGIISGRGIIKDQRFDVGNHPTTSSLLDEDCFLIRKKAWSKIGGLASIANIYYKSSYISSELHKKDYKIGLVAVDGVYKVHLPSLYSETRNISLKKQRKELFASNKSFYSNNNHYSNSYNSQFDCQLDLNFGTFKTPKNLPRVLAYSNDSWASGFYRVKAPISALAAQNKISSHFLPEKRQNITASYFEINKQYPDVLLLHNFLDDQQLSALKTYKQYLQIPIILSLDDLLTEIPSYNPYSLTNPKDMQSRIAQALNLVDRLIVSTDYLANQFNHLHADIKVVKNRLPKELWLNPNTSPNTSKQTNEKIRLGWAGATQHNDDLSWLKPVIARTKHLVQWVFYGFIPDNINPDGIEFHENTTLGKYHTTLANLNLDMAIAPLKDNTFNKAKSNLKLLEYGALGLPTICSDIENYRNSPAIKLNNETNLWTDTIIELANDNEKRLALGNDMKNWVSNEYFLEDNLDSWLDALFLK